MIPADVFAHLFSVSDRPVFLPIGYDNDEESVEALPPCGSLGTAMLLAERNAAADGWDFSGWEVVEENGPADMPGQKPARVHESRPLQAVYYRVEEWHVLG